MIFFLLQFPLFHPSKSADLLIFFWFFVLILFCLLYFQASRLPCFKAATDSMTKQKALKPIGGFEDLESFFLFRKAPWCSCLARCATGVNSMVQRTQHWSTCCMPHTAARSHILMLCDPDQTWPWCSLCWYIMPLNSSPVPHKGLFMGGCWGDGVEAATNIHLPQSWDNIIRFSTVRGTWYMVHGTLCRMK